MTEKKSRALTAVSSLILLPEVANLHILNKHFASVKDGSGLMLVTLRDDSLTMLPDRTTKYVAIKPFLVRLSE